MSNFIEAVAESIAAEGVKHIFGLMGAGTIRLVDLLNRARNIPYHASRHESGAINAADAYSRVSGCVGVAIVTWGAGFTNTITAIITAKRAASPLVLIAGDASTASRVMHPFAAGVQSVDQAGLLAMVDIPVVRANPETVAMDVARAFRLADVGGTPVALLLPLEYETLPALKKPVGVVDQAAMRLVPAELAIDEALALIDRSLRPLILAGWGAVRSGAGDHLRELADRTGALLASTERAAGLFHGHPFDLGICGGFLRPAAFDLVKTADCILSFGASLNDFTTQSLELVGHQTVIQCDTNPSAFGKHVRPTLTLCADASTAAELMLARVREGATSRSFRSSAQSARIGSFEPDWRIDMEDMSKEGALDPRSVCLRLDKIIPEERLVVTDAGIFAVHVIETMRIPGPRSLHWMINFGAIGSGMGAGVGAAIARPERTTVLFLGDGGFFMTMGDLDMAVRDRVPMVIVCMNNGAYGAELAHMRKWNIPLDNARFETPDLAAVARSIGAEAERITSLDQIDQLAERILNLKGPLFLDCTITDEPVPSTLLRNMARSQH